MLSEESIVLDRVAEATNLVSEIIGLIVHEVESLSDLLVLLFVVIELNWTWVDIAVSHFPGLELSLEGLELSAAEAKVFRSNN